MMKTKTISAVLWLLTIAFALTACGSSKSTDTEKTANDFTGNYEWVSSSFVTRGMEKAKFSTPESRGYTIVLEIHNEEIDIVKNGKKAATVRYEIKAGMDEEQLIFVTIPQDDFPFFIASGPISFSDDGEKLYINGGYNDAGENQTYKRIK